MNVSMGQLVNDAKDLVMRLKEREKNVDQAVTQSNALAKKVDAIQQLENELMNLNEKASHKSKTAVLSAIQKENRVIKLLQQENEELKESLEEHQSVLELIMTKYRQQMLQLVLLKKQQDLSEQLYKTSVFKSLQDKTDRIAEMTEVMRRAIELDDKDMNESEERLQMLQVENAGLRELLQIKSKYGIPELDLLQAQTKSTTKHDKEMQTDQTDNDDSNEVSSSSQNPIGEQLTDKNSTSDSTSSSSSSSGGDIQIEASPTS